MLDSGLFHGKARQIKVAVSHNAVSIIIILRCRETVQGKNRNIFVIRLVDCRALLGYCWPALGSQLAMCILLHRVKCVYKIGVTPAITTAVANHKDLLRCPDQGARLSLQSI